MGTITDELFDVKLQVGALVVIVCQATVKDDKIGVGFVRETHTDTKTVRVELKDRLTVVVKWNVCHVLADPHARRQLQLYTPLQQPQVQSEPYSGLVDAILTLLANADITQQIFAMHRRNNETNCTLKGFVTLPWAWLPRSRVYNVCCCDRQNRRSHSTYDPPPTECKRRRCRTVETGTNVVQCSGRTWRNTQPIPVPACCGAQTRATGASGTANKHSFVRQVLNALATNSKTKATNEFHKLTKVRTVADRFVNTVIKPVL